MELYLDFVLRNNLYQRSIFTDINRFIIKFMNFVEEVLNFKGPGNIDIS